MIQISDLDHGEVIWRYMPFERFELLIDLQALWFSKLQIFVDQEIDQEEGITPSVARQELKRQHQAMEDWFHDEERKKQVRQFVDDNENSGRELIVANCWFKDEEESQKMWDVFASGDDGVVVKSTVGALSQSIIMSHKKYWIGMVVSGWVTRCNADAAKENKSYRVVRVIDDGNRVVWGK